MRHFINKKSLFGVTGVDYFFRHGAQVVTSEAGGSSASQRATFKGTSYRLGETPDDSEGNCTCKIVYHMIFLSSVW